MSKGGAKLADKQCASCPCGRFFYFIAQFVGFQPEHGEAIRATHPIVEKHMPAIVADFYTQFL